jgi:hypothetical protein
MSTTMGARPYEFLLSEAPGTLSRDEITVLSGEDLTAGTLLGKVTASGKYVAYDDAGTDDGRRTAVGILTADCDATGGDTLAVMITRLAEVYSAKLTGADANGLADLATRNILARS